MDDRRSVPGKFLWRRWQKLAMMGRSDVVDDFGRDPRTTARWEPLLEVLYTRWFRCETGGLEHVPSRGPALLVANHAGTLPYDSAMIVHAVRRDHPERRDVRPLVEDAVCEDASPGAEHENAGVRCECDHAKEPRRSG